MARRTSAPPRTFRNVSCWPANEASGRSSAVADERTATASGTLRSGRSAVQALERGEHGGFERCREARLEYPLANLPARRRERCDVFDVERGQAPWRCACRDGPGARTARYASAVVAKPDGTRTPSRVSAPIISPSEAFLPPTVATSSIVRCANGTTWLHHRRSSRRRSWLHHGLRLRAASPGETLEDVRRRTVFFVSDQTGVTAETVGHSVLAQFAGARGSRGDAAVHIERRQGARGRAQNQSHGGGGGRAADRVQHARRGRAARHRDEAATRCSSTASRGSSARSSAELERRSAHRTGRSHPVADAAYTLRIDAINYALANDDGAGGDYGRADIVLVGVSRSGKTPTCLYMALQYGVFASNYPLTDEELEAGRCRRVSRRIARSSTR